MPTKCDPVAHRPNDFGMGATIASGSQVQSDHEFFKGLNMVRLESAC